MSPILRQAWGTFRTAWRQLLITAIAYRFVAFIILTPILGLLVRAFIATSGSAVVADEDLLFFLLHPIGLAGLVVVGGVSLAIVALEQACLMAVAYGTAHQERVDFRSALMFVLPNWLSVLALAARILIQVLAIAAPFLAAGALVFFTLLTEFDINYYLAEAPPSFRLAVALIMALIGSMAAILIYRALGWLLSLSILLFEQVGPKEALRAAAKRIVGRRKLAATFLVLWLLGATIMSVLVTGAVVTLGRLTAGAIADPGTMMLVVAWMVFALWTLGSETVVIVNTATFALVQVGFYESGATEVPTELVRRNLDRLVARPPAGIRRRTVVAAALAATLAAAAFGVGMLLQVTPEPDTQITAHRGASGSAPENTLAAVERAIADGTDWVEIDVQETADGEVVVIHDGDLMKLAGVNLNVGSATLDQLAAIDIGSSFAPEFGDQRVPTLRQVLELCRGRAGVNIELKFYGHDVRLEERVIEIVEETEMESQIVVMSLKYDAVQKMRRLRPDWTIGFLTAVAIGDLTRLDADFLAVNTGLATPSRISAAHRAGKKIHVWTVNDPVTVFAMVLRGVDGVITDHPAMGRRVLAEYSEMTPIERLVVKVAIAIGAVRIDDRQPDELG